MNPYKTIWTKTEDTIDNLLLFGFNRKLINLNFLIAAINAVLLSAKDVKAFYSFSFLEQLLMLVLLIIPFFLLIKYVLPYIYLIIGKIWKGKAAFNQLILIMSLALIPEIIYLLYILIILVIRGEIVEVNYLIRLLGWLFSLKILTIGTAKVQGFTNGLALLNLFLPVLLLGFIGIILKSF